MDLKLADTSEIKKPREETRDVSIITDFRQRCSRCKCSISGEPLSFNLVDVIDDKERHEAQYAVAGAMYAESQGPTAVPFYEVSYSGQAGWLRAAAADSWHIENFSFDAIGLGMHPGVRAAGVEEAKKWRAYTDKRKVFRASSVKFPPGWLCLSFQAHGSKDGKPVEHGYVMVHICPDCAPAIFDVTNVDPAEPFGDGVKW